MTQTPAITLIRSARTVYSLPHCRAATLFDRHTEYFSPNTLGTPPPGGRISFDSLPTEIYERIAECTSTNGHGSLYALSASQKRCFGAANSALYRTIENINALETVSAPPMNREVSHKLDTRHPASFIRTLKFTLDPEFDSEKTSDSIHFFQVALFNSIHFTTGTPGRSLLNVLIVDLGERSFVDIFAEVEGAKFRLREFRVKALLTVDEKRQCESILDTLLNESMHALEIGLKAVGPDGSVLDSGIYYASFLEIVDCRAPNLIKLIFSIHCTHSASLFELNTAFGTTFLSELEEMEIMFSLAYWAESPQLDISTFLRQSSIRRFSIGFSSAYALSHFLPPISSTRLTMTSSLKHFEGRLADYFVLQGTADVIALNSLTLHLCPQSGISDEELEMILSQTGTTLTKLRLAENWTHQSNATIIANDWSRYSCSASQCAVVMRHCKNLEELELHLPWQVVETHSELIVTVLRDLPALQRFHGHVYMPLPQITTAPGCRARLGLDNLDSRLKLSKWKGQERRVTTKLCIYGINVIGSGDELSLGVVQDVFEYIIASV